MQALIINGSARGDKGVTARLLEALGRGLAQGGARVEALAVKGMAIAPCLACLQCMHAHPGRCAQDDDMARVYPLLKAADLLVLGAPVYTDGYPAQLKALLDRCICNMYPYLHTGADGSTRHPLAWPMPRDFLLVSTCGFPEPATFAPLIANFRAQAANWDARPLAELCLPGSLAVQVDRALLEPRLELLAECGRQVAARGEIDPATLAAANRPLLSGDRFRELAARYEAWCRKRLERD